MPEISVIMGVYNQFNRDVLFTAIKSILNQTFKDIEFIIYDDGSQPDATRLLYEAKALDERIIIIGKEENNGLAFALNECIRCAKGNYIARMDADDYSFPNRLKKQKEFLDAHQEYSWCGTNTELFDDNGVWGSRFMPERPEKKDYLKYSPYVHPTVMYRRELLIDTEGYLVSELTTRCEDYELFMRFRREGYRGYNIQEILFGYREDMAAYSRRNWNSRVNETRLRYRNFVDMGILWPKGWLYALRPIIAGLMPNSLIMFIKRRQASDKK